MVADEDWSLAMLKRLLSSLRLPCSFPLFGLFLEHSNITDTELLKESMKISILIIKKILLTVDISVGTET